MTPKNRKVTSLSEEEKATALKTVGGELAKLERKHGEAIVFWVVGRRHDQRIERARLQKEKRELEARLAEIGDA